MARKKKVKGKIIKLLGKSSAKLVGALEGLAPLEAVVAPKIRKHLRGLAKGADFVTKALELLVPPKVRKPKKGGEKKSKKKSKKEAEPTPKGKEKKKEKKEKKKGKKTKK